jgi:hypothetical protein
MAVDNAVQNIGRMKLPVRPSVKANHEDGLSTLTVSASGKVPVVGEVWLICTTRCMGRGKTSEVERYVDASHQFVADKFEENLAEHGGVEALFADPEP